MKELFIKQKVFSVGEKFTIKDAQENDVYFVEGSFMKIPKTFQIMDTNRQEIAVITKKTFSFLPKFFVDVQGEEIVMIKKEFTFLKSKFTIESSDIEVVGNWWDMDFQIFRGGEVIGQVNKEWFSWGDSYKVQIMDETKETLIIALVVAIDCAKAEDSAATNAANFSN
ncbi:LURP-one-related/scramblase family protein [Oceanobacillus sp. CAU 1775]